PEIRSIIFASFPDSYPTRNPHRQNGADSRESSPPRRQLITFLPGAYLRVVKNNQYFHSKFYSSFNMDNEVVIIFLIIFKSVFYFKPFDSLAQFQKLN